jgi:hypothetical protein
LREISPDVIDVDDLVATDTAIGSSHDPHRPLQDGADKATDADIRGWRSAISAHVANAALTDTEVISIHAYSVETGAHGLLALIKHIHQRRSRMDNHQEFTLPDGVVSCNTNVHMASFIYGFRHFKM